MAAALAFSASSYVGSEVATLYGGGTGKSPWKLVSVKDTPRKSPTKGELTVSDTQVGCTYQGRRQLPGQWGRRGAEVRLSRGSLTPKPPLPQRQTPATGSGPETFQPGLRQMCTAAPRQQTPAKSRPRCGAGRKKEGDDGEEKERDPHHKQTSVIVQHFITPPQTRKHPV